jgi:hypothetical protein
VRDYVSSFSGRDKSTLDLSIGAGSKVIGRLWKGRVSKAKTLDGAWRRDWTI